MSETNGNERKKLPDPLPGLAEKISKPIGVRPQLSDTVRAWK